MLLAAAISPVSTADTYQVPDSPSAQSTEALSIPPEDYMRDLRRHYPGANDSAIEAFVADQGLKVELTESFARNTTFAGAYSDGPGQPWVILATDAVTAAEQLRTAERAGLDASSRTVRRDYTFLEDISRSIAQSQALHGQRFAVSVDVPRNAVTLVTQTPMDLKVVSPLLSSEQREAVHMEVGQLPAMYEAACSSRYACGTPGRGGVSIGRRASSGNYTSAMCSVGFFARADDGSYWLYTAGHCFRQPLVDARETIGHGEQYYGYVRDSIETATVDAARVRVSNPYWLSSSFGYMYGSASTTLSVTSAITSTASVQEGQVVCFQGRNLEVGDDRCGIVTRENYSGKPQVSGLTVCGGDSGGSVYMPVSGGNRAYGLVSVTSERDADGCTAAGSGQMSWSNLPHINSWMDGLTSPGNIRVVTR